ncbi:MAG TPA: response regulator transcription factor [Symbiobacteriaceae bacterium]|nr:response regulator transcription factor [Symbiobacteriaceae bacterium]
MLVVPERILVVDDEASILQLVTYNLIRAGYEVVSAESGEEALQVAKREPLDLILLDVMLPGMDGFEVCKEIRKGSAVPILMLTARGEEIDRVVGFEIGADDYVTKPFSPRELLGRVKAILRRSKKGAEPTGGETLTFGALSINFVTYEVLKGEERIDLTPTEFQLLKLLCQHPGRVFSRDELVDRVIGADFYGDVRTIDVHIRHLRAKIEIDPSDPKLIETVRGAGYKFSGGKKSGGQPSRTTQS